MGTMARRPYDAETRAMMQKITFTHGGAEFDARYPDGIPTQIDITTSDGQTLSSGMVMYPSGHARNTAAALDDILQHKNRLLGDVVFADRSTVDTFVQRLVDMKTASPAEVAKLYEFDFNAIRQHKCIDG